MYDTSLLFHTRGIQGTVHNSSSCLANDFVFLTALILDVMKALISCLSNLLFFFLWKRQSFLFYVNVSDHRDCVFTVELLLNFIYFFFLFFLILERFYLIFHEQIDDASASISLAQLAKVYVYILLSI